MAKCGQGCQCGRHGAVASERARARALGRTLSQETRDRMSEAHRLRHAEDPSLRERSLAAAFAAREAKGFKMPGADSAERARAWREENREKYREGLKAWRETPEGRAVHDHHAALRRQRLSITSDGNEYVDRLVVFHRDDGTCQICGELVNPFDFHVDHIKPLAKGGKHCYSNVQLAHPACNRIKGDR